MTIPPVRYSILLLALFLAPALRAQGNFAGADEKWRHYAAPNFELYSRNSDELSRNLLHDLELLRAFFMESFKLVERRRLEVTVYYFKSEKDFRSYAAEFYGAKHKFVGFYVNGIDRAVIYMIPGDDSEASRQTIFHEYIHHLFRVAEENPPKWLDEGVAELFSTLTPKSGKMEFGNPAAGRLWQAQNQSLMPLERLFAVDDSSSVFQQGGEHTGLFYAQSWALAHYFYFGDSKIAAEKRNRFLSLALKNSFKSGAEMRTAFQEVFGMDYPEMLKKLERYLREGKYYSGSLPLPDIPGTRSYLARAVPLDEIQVRLAELALRVSRSPYAKLALLQATEKNPGDFRSWESLGADALRDKEEVVARERWTRAVDANTRNPAIYRELALMEGRSAFSQFNAYYRLPAEKAGRMRDYLARSIEYNPEQSAAYEMLAWVEAFAPVPSIKNVLLVQKKYRDLMRKERTALALAFVRVRLDKPGEALEILADLETMQPDDWEKYGIEAIRMHLEERSTLRENSQPGTSRAPLLKIEPPKIQKVNGSGG